MKASEIKEGMEMLVNRNSFGGNDWHKITVKEIIKITDSYVKFSYIDEFGAEKTSNCTQKGNSKFKHIQ